MLVTCPECNAKISSESEECKRCGLPAAARRSEEYCIYLFKKISCLTINTRKHSAEEHDIKTIISATETQVQYGMDSEDAVRFQQGIAKGIRGKYFEILDFHIDQFAHSTGYRLNILLKCILCGKTVLVYSNPRSTDIRYLPINITC